MPGLWRLGIAAVLLNALSTRGLAAVAVCEDAIGRSFHAPPSQEIWLAEALMVACTLSLPVTPWLLERLGQRRLLVLCTAGFLVSSLGATSCGSLDALVGWLVVQGLSTAPLLPLTQAMLADGFPESRRNLAMALWNGGNVLGILLGSFGADLALATGDWHHVFWLGWPLALGGLALDGLLIASLLVSLVGKSGVLLYQPEASVGAALWPAVVSNLGYWMVVTALSIAVLKGLDAGVRPAASALFALSGTLGNTLGLAVLDGLFDWHSRFVSAPRAFSQVFWLEWAGVLALLLLAVRLRLRYGRLR